MRVQDLREIPPDFAPVWSVDSTPVLLVSAAGHTVTIGPLYVPGSGVCPACTGYRARTAGWDRPPATAPSAEALQAMEAAAAEVLESFSQESLSQSHGMAVLHRSLWEIDCATGMRRLHPVVPRADCPRCGLLHDSSRPLADHCSPLTGIIAAVTVSSQPFAGSYSAMGDYVAPLPSPGTRLLIRAQTALGKGHSSIQAIESCIGEALERYSLIYRGTENVVRARVGDVNAIDPREILLVSGNQYANREAWNACHPDRYWIPERFDPASPIDLLQGVDLNSGESVLVPAACCLMWHFFKPGETKFASADSIGCGAGRTVEEATASALLEWIERDAMAIWWYNRVPRPGVLPESFESEYLNQIREALRQRNRDLYLLDIRNEIDMPVYAAISPSADGTEPVFAAAAHPSPRVAAAKAAAEIAQIIFSTVQLGGLDREFHGWLNSVTMENQPWLRPSGFRDAPAEPGPLSAGDTVSMCVDRLARCGLRAIAVDQSRPDVLLKTVRAIVPGLRHIWARFAPGRLYDVPVRLGWKEQAGGEESLNPFLCMI